MIIEEAGGGAAEQPAYAIANIEKSESGVALALRQYASDQHLEQRVLRCVADAPEGQGN